MKSTPPEKHITTSETAQMLGISETSVKNWVRHGFIETVLDDADLIFRKEDVLSLQNRILNGELRRLNSRANKSNSSRTFLPDELFIKDDEKRAVAEISSFIMRHNTEVSSALFILSLNLLYKKGMLEGTNPGEVLNAREIVIKNRKSLGDILQQWRDSLISELADVFPEIMNVGIPDHSNIIGIIYQSILMEGDRSRLGMYYTPDNVVTEIVSRIASPCDLFLDPCCGTGQFLLAFADMADNPENIYGIDIDPIAVNVAKINLLMKFPDLDFYPKIYCADSLLDLNESILLDKKNSLSEFDCIATNPPWGSHFKKDELKNLRFYYPEITSGESFSYFLIKSLRMLKDGGVLSFVLPESMLNVKIHSDIRKYIFMNYNISRIEEKKKIFRNVFSPAMVIDIRNTKGNKEVEIVNKKECFRIKHERFGRNLNFVYDINIDASDEKIIEKIYSHRHVNLKGNAQWALGIVTGNNSEYVKDKNDRWNEPVIKGTDISPYRINPPGTFIKFQPEKFQQTPDERFYRCDEKLVYRYISGRLIFACDRERRLTLNSANILIPEIDGVDIKVIMALFNSELYQYIFQKKFSSVKVLRSHLEELPVPVLNDSQYKRIIRMVDEIVCGGTAEKLDNYIYEIFGLIKTEISHIKNGIK